MICMTAGNFGLVSSNSGSGDVLSLLSANWTTGACASYGGPSGLPALGRASYSQQHVTLAIAQMAISRLFYCDTDVDPPLTIATGLNKRTTITALAALDLVGCLGFFVFAVCFILWTRSLARSADESTVTIK